jgi:hypothetical protein
MAVPQYLNQRSKFGNQKALHRNFGYDSRFEAQVRMILDEHLAKGTLVEIENQVAVSLDAHGEHIADYKVDFRVTHKDGRLIWIEAKGFATADWRLKRNLMEKIYIKHQHPEEEYIVVTKSNFGGRNAFDKTW